MVEKEKDENAEKDVDAKIKETLDIMRDHGLGCGLKIAEIAKLLHPDSLLIVPLYRSCIVVEQSEKEKNEGSCTIRAYGDPHWLGAEIDIEALKSAEFHFIYRVHGDRQGPEIVRIPKDKEKD